MIVSKIIDGLDGNWSALIETQRTLPYFQKLENFLDSEIKGGAEIYPPSQYIFEALRLTNFDAVKIVILGQDPYHGAGQAHGLAFSVANGVPIPPSLRNIYKELSAEYNVPPPTSGNLTAWARQGILLLNATLTVRASEAGSHQNQGWEIFTDEIIKGLAAQSQPIVFMLWGAYAQKKAALIDDKRHLILTAPHPSPLSAHRGFLGCGHFKKANEFLKENRMSEIKWI
jgi:uracil-DNA glycosylase